MTRNLPPPNETPSLYGEGGDPVFSASELLFLAAGILIGVMVTIAIL